MRHDVAMLEVVRGGPQSYLPLTLPEVCDYACEEIRPMRPPKPHQTINSMPPAISPAMWPLPRPPRPASPASLPSPP